MDIIHQYYNEIVLVLSNYDTDFQGNIVIIHVPDDGKPFDVVYKKIHQQIQKIEQMLDSRDKEVVIRIQRTNESKDILLEKNDEEFK
jgi:hypothetical protein